MSFGNEAVSAPRAEQNRKNANAVRCGTDSSAHSGAPGSPPGNRAGVRSAGEVFRGGGSGVGRTGGGIAGRHAGCSRSRRGGRTCLWPPPASATWHCAHLVLKIFAPVKADIQDGNGGDELGRPRGGTRATTFERASRCAARSRVSRRTLGDVTGGSFSEGSHVSLRVCGEQCRDNP